MIRQRLITVLTLNDGVLFRTRNFQPDYRYTLNFVDAWSVDEVVLLDITRPGQGSRENFYTVVEAFEKEVAGKQHSDEDKPDSVQIHDRPPDKRLRYGVAEAFVDWRFIFCIFRKQVDIDHEEHAVEQRVNDERRQQHVDGYIW